ncbi:hypothetical protein [Umezawaea sp. Da 62-37]|uniref:hypothetical protein n=1 Tax=Umezawaea sp. Da 62-37 TaxID=3075927 RepID=UPI0028F74C55|nr:hypothetical protein [Umezawaea sp. Da 62-37]WNV90999.1 hypothetical protein RM788_22790 [Umezawaea sp. Da 62-37]
MGKHGTSAALGAFIGTAIVALVFLGQPEALPDDGGVVAQALLLGLIVGGPAGLFLGYLTSRIREVGATPPPPALPPAPRPYSPYPAQRPHPAAQRPFPGWSTHTATGNVDLWGGLVLQCEGSVGRVTAAVQTVPDSPVKEWMSRIAFQFQQELEHVRNIARLARALDATARDHPALQRLLAAAHDFAAFESEVGMVALKVLDNPELARARTDLEFLEQQLPHLKG